MHNLQEECIAVGIRLKPTNQPSIFNVLNQKSLMLKNSNEGFNFGKELLSPSIQDYVFSDQHTSQDIFDHSLRHIVEKCFQGFNGCICAYGQTASGKTFTMKGTSEQTGLVPITIQHCLQMIEQDQESNYVIKASYVELYNEQIIDLLSENRTIVELLTNNERNAYLSNVTKVQIKSFEQFQEIQYFHSSNIFNLICSEFGEKQRSFGETKLNEYSSRSHVIFQLSIKSRGKDLPLFTRNSLLYLVDLAGSENVQKTFAEGVRRKEGQMINKSLLALQTVVTRLKEKNQQYINYRDSKLTRLLQNNLSGNSITFVLLTVSQSQENLQESINTMRFGISAGALKTIAKQNLDQGEEQDTKTRQEDEHLKEQLKEMSDKTEQLGHQVARQEEEIHYLKASLQQSQLEEEKTLQQNSILKEQNQLLLHERESLYLKIEQQLTAPKEYKLYSHQHTQTTTQVAHDYGVQCSFDDNPKEDKLSKQESKRQPQSCYETTLEDMESIMNLRCELIQKAKDNQVKDMYIKKLNKDLKETQQKNLLLETKIYELNEEVIRLKDDQTLELKENFMQNIEQSKKVSVDVKKKIQNSPTKSQVKKQLTRSKDLLKNYQNQIKKYQSEIDQSIQEKEQLRKIGYQLYQELINNNFDLSFIKYS